MKTIDININKACIKTVQIDFERDNHTLKRPEVSATINLFSGDKKVTEFSISTKSYFSQKFELPLGMLGPITAIGKELEAILTQECVTALRRIEAKPQPDAD